MADELLLKNASVYTLDSSQTVADSVLICGERIAAVGKEDEIKHLTRSAVKTVDLGGRAVFPGFIDTHVHLMHTGLNLLAVDLSTASGISEVQELLHERAAKLQPGQLVRGIRIDDSILDERRMPLSAELDKVSRRHPILVSRVDGHSSSVNTLAMESLGINSKFTGVVKGADGKPNGILLRDASGSARTGVSLLMSSEEKVEGLKLACNKAIAKGITTVHALEGGMLFGDTEIYQVQDFASRAPLRITPYFQTLDVEKAIAAGVRRIGGCIPLDGSIGSRTAALAEPYSDQPETSGSIYHSDEAIKKFMTDAYSAGMQISVHAIGERAIDQALDSFEHAARHFPGYSYPHRIEHFIMATDEHINRAVSLGLVISIQPVDHLIWGRPDRLLGVRLGDRLHRINRYKTWAARGLVLAGSSDSDITEFDPLKGIYGAMHHYFSEECLDFSDALRLYTSNAALAGLELPEKGTVEVGKLADLVVLSGPVKDGRDFGSLEVDMTLVGGRVVYGDPERL